MTQKDLKVTTIDLLIVCHEKRISILMDELADLKNGIIPESMCLKERNLKRQEK